MPHLPRSVCVYCGSRMGLRPDYARDAAATGRMLAENHWRLVYGAGDVGLMGVVARAAQTAQGRTFGVIPVHLLNREVGKRDLDVLVVTETMHERKKVMIMNADAIVMLPGGAGSLDEFFEALTWRQLGLHAKPLFLLNTANYWQPLISIMTQMVDEGFAEPDVPGFVQVVPDVAALQTGLRRASG